MSAIGSVIDVSVKVFRYNYNNYNSNKSESLQSATGSTYPGQLLRRRRHKQLFLQQVRKRILFHKG